MNACNTPLLDLLRSIPADARLIYEHSPTHSQSIPVGVWAAECVAEIERLTDDYAAATHLLADRDAHIERLKAELAALRAALAELVSCNDICIATVDLTELYYRKERAWEAARALRSGSEI